MFLIRNNVNNDKDSCLSEMAGGVQEYGKASIWNILCRAAYRDHIGENLIAEGLLATSR